MSIFSLYFNLGTHHILNFDAYDHILFITTLLAVYKLKQWRKVVVLITAFTIGHATTLVLFTLGVFSIQPRFVEFFIAVTIIITAIPNILVPLQDKLNKNLYYSKYLISALFGMVHGMGFSSYLKAMFDGSRNMVTALFAFNLGIETGQFVVVSALFLFSWIVLNYLNIKQVIWNYILSSIGLIVAFVLFVQRWPF